MVCVTSTPQDSMNNTLYYSWVYSYTISFGVQYTPVLVVSVKYMLGVHSHHRCETNLVYITHYALSTWKYHMLHYCRQSMCTPHHNYASFCIYNTHYMLYSVHTTPMYSVCCTPLYTNDVITSLVYMWQLHFKFKKGRHFRFVFCMCEKPHIKGKFHCLSQYFTMQSMIYTCNQLT